MSNLNTKKTNIVPIFDAYGKKLNEIILKESIIPIPNKRGGFGESGCFYKGAGVVYKNHLECDRGEKTNKETCDFPGYQIIGRTGIVYENLIVSYKNLVDEFGIFTFKHQPVFSDYEGACGPKEKRLLDNFSKFEKCAIEEVTDVIPTGLPDTNIYVYRLKNLSGSLEDTLRLIEYVLANDWNTAWDKNVWEDIECYGYVRDVADWFISEKYCHKLGTIFAILNSMYDKDKVLYARLIMNIFGTYEFNKKMVLFYSAEIVRKICSDFAGGEYTLYCDSPEWFEILYEQLITGKACCHLEDEEEWEWVREHFRERLQRNIKKRDYRNLYSMVILTL